MENEKPHRSRRIALGKRIRTIPSLHCCGVRPNWEDYPPHAMEAIRDAEIVYYPSRLYEDLFLLLGKKVFPNNYYRFMGNKIRQTHLFQILGIPHPHTRLYYGRNRAERILADFRFPFIAKMPVGSSKGKGVFLLRSRADLEGYLETCFPAYIQEYLPVDRDLRIVVVRGRVVHAYWKIQRSGEFRNNVFQGATISYDDIPARALEFAEDVARRCRFDEVGLDICLFEGKYTVIEANMVFGMEGFQRAGIDMDEIFAALERDGLL